MAIWALFHILYQEDNFLLAFNLIFHFIFHSINKPNNNIFQYNFNKGFAEMIFYCGETFSISTTSWLRSRSIFWNKKTLLKRLVLNKEGFPQPPPVKENRREKGSERERERERERGRGRGGRGGERFVIWQVS